MARAAVDPVTGLTPKQEAFCQEYLKNGGSAAAAYRASYDTKAAESTIGAEASRLINNPLITARIAVLRKAVLEASMGDAALDKAWVLKRLKAVAQRCMQVEPVLDRKGNPVMVETPDGGLAPAFTFDASGANRSLELLGKELGMFVERKESGKPGDFSNMGKEDLRKSIKERSVRLGMAKVLPIRKTG